MNESRLPLREAVETMCRDSLESSMAEVRERDDDGEITVAMQRIIEALDALESAPREWIDDADLWGKYMAWREALGA